MQAHLAINNKGSALILVMVIVGVIGALGYYVSGKAQIAAKEAAHVTHLGEIKDLESFLANSLSCNETIAANSGAANLYIYGRNGQTVLLKHTGTPEYMAISKWRIWVESYNAGTKEFVIKVKWLNEDKWITLFKGDPLKC